MFAVIRIGEYGVDYFSGDQNGHFSTPVLRHAVTASYLVLLLAILLTFFARVRAWLASSVCSRNMATLNPRQRFSFGLCLAGVHLLLSVGVFWVARHFLAFSAGWLRILVALLGVSLIGMVLTTITPGADRKTLFYRLGLLVFSLGILYATACVLDVLVYRYGYHLPFFSQRVRDYYYSAGVFDQNSHPRYRQPFDGYILSPLATAGRPGDIYATYNLPLHSLELAWPQPDELGWPNQHALHEAEALFIGDSFGRANAAGFAHSIPVRLEALTHLKTYVAANEGYGLGQYAGILRYLTQGLPQSERFQGKFVYILLYLGNDISLDLTNFLARRRHAAQFSEVAFHARLTALVRLASLARTISAKRITTTQPVYPLVTEDDVATIASERQRTDGWYPHFFTIPLYQGQPFAFDQGNFAEFRTITWLEKRRLHVRELLQDIQSTAQQTGVTVRFVMLPTRLQILAPYFREIPSDQRLEFDRWFPNLIASEEQIRMMLGQELQGLGFETLDMTPIFEEMVFRIPLFWAGDLHYTPEGYHLIGERIATTFHQ